MTDQRRDLLENRVELIDILPRVWREILVPARYSFWDLHVAIQDAMGWLDYHLHEFRFGWPSRDDALLIGIPSDEIWDDSPEDCGGVHGYQSLLDILFDPSHPEHESMRYWIPKGWGPELFKPEKVRFDNPLKRWDLSGPIDLRAHYFANCRLFFTLGATLLLMLTLVDAFVGGQPFLHPENAVRLPATILVIQAALFPNEKFQATFALLAVALFIGFVSVSYHA